MHDNTPPHRGADFTNPNVLAKAVFQVLTRALSRPGSIVALPVELRVPSPLTSELASVALAMADQEAPLWLDASLVNSPQAMQYLRYHTGARVVGAPSQAAYALIRDAVSMPQLHTFGQGIPGQPEQSTTLVIAVDYLAPTQPGTRGAMVLSGPNVAGQTALIAGPLPLDFQAQIAENRRRYPLGVDCFLVSQGCVAAIPRSTTIL